MPWSVQQALTIDVVAGIILHAYCRNNEPDNYWTFSAILLLLPLLPASLLSPHFSSVTLCLLVAFSVFFAALFSSMVLYRVSPIHPLAGYPGPLLWRVTKFSAAWYGAQGNYHIHLKRLHEQYGPIVRIGPNELSIAQKELVPFILGPQGMPKGPLWEGRRILPSKNFDINNHMVGVRDLARHSELRTPWNKAFAVGPLKDYEDMLTSRASMMGNRLDDLCEGAGEDSIPIDLAQWLSFFAFDFMGDIAFTSDFSLLELGDVNGFIKNMEDAQWLPTVVQHVPWLAKITRSTPFVGTNLRKFGAFALEQAKKRATKGNVAKDLFYHLIQAVDPDFMASPLPFIVANSVLTILAGSDTVASALSTIIFSLLRNPGCYKQLQQEIDEAVSESGDPLPAPSRLAQLPYLNAVVHEALRIQPPVPSSLQRAPKVGSGGKMLGSKFIPEGTNIQVPPYVLHRDPRNFYPSPDNFWPERWLREDNNEGDGIVHERAAFIPFSTGPANCAGKPLAMMELRYVTAMLIRKFDMVFQDKFDPGAWEESLSDRLLLFRAPLLVDLRRRI